MSNYELHQETQQNLNRIDQQLDALVDITGTSKVLANQIGGELNDQNEILRQTNDHMDSTNNQVKKAVIATQKLKHTPCSWLAWILSLLLVIANVLVLILLK